MRAAQTCNVMIRSAESTAVCAGAPAGTRPPSCTKGGASVTALPLLLTLCSASNSTQIVNGDVVTHKMLKNQVCEATICRRDRRSQHVERNATFCGVLLFLPAVVDQTAVSQFLQRRIHLSRPLRPGAVCIGLPDFSCARHAFTAARRSPSPCLPPPFCFRLLL